MADQGQAPAAAELREIPLKRIGPRADNARKEFDKEALEQLAASIRQEGVIEPIVVQPFAGEGDKETFEIIAGERRWRACGMAGLASVPCIIRRGLSAEQASVIHLVENLQRSDLKFSELCAGTATLVNLLKAEMSAQPEGAKYKNRSVLEVAAERVGQSKAWVSRHAAVLTALPKEVQDLVGAGKVTSVDIAHELAKLHELDRDAFDGLVQSYHPDPDDLEEDEDPADRYPTRSHVRMRIESAEAVAERKKQAAAERAKTQAANAGKPAAQPQRSPYEIRGEKLEKMRPDVNKLGNAICGAIAKAAGVTSKNDWESPVRVRDDLPTRYDNAPLPKSFGEVVFKVELSGRIDSINQAFQALAPGGKIQFKETPAFTIAEARKIEAALGRKLEWEAAETIKGTAAGFRMKLASAKAPLAWWPDEPEAAKKAVAAAKKPAAKKTPAKAAAKKAPAKAKKG